MPSRAARRARVLIPRSDLCQVAQTDVAALTEWPLTMRRTRALRSRVGRSAREWRGAYETFRQSPFLFEQQNASKLRKPVRAVLEHAQDRFPVGDRQRHDVAFVVVGVLERFGSVVNAFRAEALRQLEYESVRDRETGEEHQPDTDRFRGQRPAQPIPSSSSVTASTVLVSPLLCPASPSAQTDAAPWQVAETDVAA
jgi:hypothetical protein